MRHRKAGKQLSRNSSHRRALLRNMVTSLLKHERIETTDAKAKSIRPVAEKMITLAKRGDLHARRQALAYIQDKAVTHKLFDEIKDRYLDKQGGYIRIVKKGVRKGDGAPVSIVQLIPQDEEKKTGKKKAKKPKKVSTPQPPVQKEAVVKTKDEVAEKLPDEAPDAAEETAEAEVKAEADQEITSGPEESTPVEEASQEEVLVNKKGEDTEDDPDETPLEEEKETSAEEDGQEKSPDNIEDKK